VAGLGALALLLAACGSEPTAPGMDRPGSGFGSGTSNSGSSLATLVGTWQTTAVIEVPGDVQTSTTTWQFDADGTCRLTMTTESLAEGFPRTAERACTWTVSGTRLSVTFAGGGTLDLEFSFAGLSPDRLVLDGFEYHRAT
jgi:lipocalin-like protein